TTMCQNTGVSGGLRVSDIICKFGMCLTTKRNSRNIVCGLSLLCYWRKRLLFRIMHQHAEVGYVIDVVGVDFDVVDGRGEGAGDEGAKAFAKGQFVGSDESAS